MFLKIGKHMHNPQAPAGFGETVVEKNLPCDMFDKELNGNCQCSS